jgi:hypothetical protein
MQLLVQHEAGEQREGKPEALKPRAGEVASSQLAGRNWSSWITRCSATLPKTSNRWA